MFVKKIGTRFHDTHARIWRQFSGAGFWRRFLVRVSLALGKTDVVGKRRQRGSRPIRAYNHEVDRIGVAGNWQWLQTAVDERRRHSRRRSAPSSTTTTLYRVIVAVPGALRGGNSSAVSSGTHCTRRWLQSDVWSRSSGSHTSHIYCVSTDSQNKYLYHVSVTVVFVWLKLSSEVTTR